MGRKSSLMTLGGETLGTGVTMDDFRFTGTNPSARELL